MPAGVHNYRVQFTLPSPLPSSYVGRYGFIRYTIKLHIDVSWNFDSKFVVEFNVCAPIDISLMSEIHEPVNVEQSKQFTMCCIPVGGLYLLTLNLPYSGFCNEQKIPISLECANNSNTYIKGIKVALRKLVTYQSTLPHKESKRDDIKLSLLKFQVSIDKQQTKQFTGELQVPPLTALNLNDCSIIEVSHRLEVITEISGCRSNYVFDVPVTIGHIGQISGPPMYTTTDIMGRGPPSYDIAMLNSTPVVPSSI